MNKNMYISSYCVPVCPEEDRVEIRACQGSDSFTNTIDRQKSSESANSLYFSASDEEEESDKSRTILGISECGRTVSTEQGDEVEEPQGNQNLCDGYPYQAHTRNQAVQCDILQSNGVESPTDASSNQKTPCVNRSHSSEGIEGGFFHVNNFMSTSKPGRGIPVSSFDNEQLFERLLNRGSEPDIGNGEESTKNQRNEENDGIHRLQNALSEINITTTLPKTVCDRLSRELVKVKADNTVLKKYVIQLYASLTQARSLLKSYEENCQMNVVFDKSKHQSYIQLQRERISLQCQSYDYTDEGAYSQGSIDIHVGRREAEEQNQAHLHQMQYADCPREQVESRKFFLKNGFHPDPALKRMGPGFRHANIAGDRFVHSSKSYEWNDIRPTQSGHGAIDKR